MSMVRATAKRATGDLPGIDAREREENERSWGLQKTCRRLHDGSETALLPDLEAQAPRILRLVAVGSIVLTARLQCPQACYPPCLPSLFFSRGCFELASGGGGEREIDGDASIPNPRREARDY